VIALGLEYGLMTPFTSFLALENEAAYAQMGVTRRSSRLRPARLASLSDGAESSGPAPGAILPLFVGCEAQPSSEKVAGSAVAKDEAKASVNNEAPTQVGEIQAGVVPPVAAAEPAAAAAQAAAPTMAAARAMTGGQTMRSKAYRAAPESDAVDWLAVDRAIQRIGDPEKRIEARAWREVSPCSDPGLSRANWVLASATRPSAHSP